MDRENISDKDKENISAPTTDSVETPLLQANHKRQPSLPPLYPQQQQQHQPQQREHEVIIDGENDDTGLDKSLHTLYFYLMFLGYHQISIPSIVLSLIAFLLVGVAIPVIILELNNCSGCEDYQRKQFEYICLTSQACLAAVSLGIVSHHLRKRGMRSFVFVDKHKGHMARFKDKYIEKIKDSYKKLLYFLLPCLMLKAAREIFRLAVVGDDWWKSVLILLGLMISWTYVNAISLAGCILFHVVCSLQLIHFDDFCKLLSHEPDMYSLMQEHMRLRHYLSKISHRFRIYLLLVFFVVTVSQVVTLTQITTYSGSITFLNGGDLAVTAIVQVVVVILCLHAGTKISHKAQSIVSVASKWHAEATNMSHSEGSRSRHSRSFGSLDLPSNWGASPVHFSYSESDLESLDSISLSSHLVTFVASYHKRQSFVLYLQTNPGGITIFGWTVDRVLLNTIFFIELSLVLFVLGNTVVFSPGLTLGSKA